MNEFQEHCKYNIMSRVLEIRYTDLEEEKELCDQLLEWAQQAGDLYGKAFAHTYLGDYHVALNDGALAGPHLLAARKLLEKQNFPELLLRVFSLLAIYYEMQADEQSSVQYYLEAIAVARRLGDFAAESQVLNNLAFAFQRHHCYEEALHYYEESYRLHVKSPAPTGQVVLSNLTILLLSLGRLEEAREYMEEAERTDGDPQLKEIGHLLNWCCYYAALGDWEQTRQWADRVLQHADEISENRLSAFENFNSICECMFTIGSQKYAGKFLELMERAGVGGGLDQMRSLQEKKIRYCLQFEPETKHGQAYREFFRQNRAFNDLANKAIVNAMKGQINLDQALLQKEKLQSQQQTLERQANLDELTQVYNRRYLDKLIQERNNQFVDGFLGVIMIDVDFFKEYNDFYGHIRGDQVLQEIGKCLTGCAGDRVFACRFGGDEFTCLCDGMNEKEIMGYIRAVRACLKTQAIPHEKSPCGARVTLSIGYALAEQDEGADAHQLLKLADQALYETKLMGRNSYTGKHADGN